MFYLITNQENTTWQGKNWGENVSHEESNHNYQYDVYQSPLVAAFMYPCYQGSIVNPKLWTAVGETQTSGDGLRLKFMKLTTLKEYPFTQPSEEQCIVFGILAALNLVQIPIFLDWAKAYLQGKDTTKETAELVSKQLHELLYEEPPEYISPAVTALSSVSQNNPRVYAANAAHRAWCDSFDENTPLNLGNAASDVNLHQLAQIALTLPPQEIVKLL